jgi:hypothetical protein
MTVTYALATGENAAAAIEVPNFHPVGHMADAIGRS